jgi:hypothetical protein
MPGSEQQFDKKTRHMALGDKAERDTMLNTASPPNGITGKKRD